MLFYNGQWIHWSRREDEVLKPASWENEQGKCTMKTMDNKNKFGIKTFVEYVNLFSYNCYLNREIHIICGEHNTTKFSEISACYNHFCFVLFFVGFGFVCFLFVLSYKCLRTINWLYPIVLRKYVLNSDTKPSYSEKAFKTWSSCCLIGTKSGKQTINNMRRANRGWLFCVRQELRSSQQNHWMPDLKRTEGSTSQCDV